MWDGVKMRVISRSVAAIYDMTSIVVRNCYGEAARIYEYKFNLES